MKSIVWTLEKKLEIMEKESYLPIKVQEKRLDILSASGLKEELSVFVESQTSSNFVLDISNCFYCDASGLNTMVYVHQQCKRMDKNLILIGVRPNVEKLIRICELHYLFMIAKDIREAKEILKQVA